MTAFAMAGIEGNRDSTLAAERPHPALELIAAHRPKFAQICANGKLFVRADSEFAGAVLRRHAQLLALPVGDRIDQEVAEHRHPLGMAQLLGIDEIGLDRRPLQLG